MSEEMMDPGNTGLKKGMRIKIKDNPRDPNSKFLGIAKLLTCKDRKAFIDHPGEVWNVEYEATGYRRAHIVNPVDVIPDEPK